MSPTSLPEGWHIPLTQWFTVQLITGTTVAFTSASSPWRNAAALLAFATAYSVQLSAQQYLPGTRFGAPIVAMCWINVLNAIDLLVLSRASYEAQQDYDSKANLSPNSTASKSPPNPSLLERYIWSLALTFNYRRINTPWQIRSLPAFNPQNPTYAPSRTSFLLTSLTKLICSVAIIHIFTIETSDPYLTHAVTHLPTKPEEILLPFLYHPSTTTLGWKRDLILRTLFTLSFGIIARATIVAGYTLFAVLSVGSGLQQPRMWPPVEGGIWEAGWCLRGFWGYVSSSFSLLPSSFLTPLLSYIQFALLPLYLDQYPYDLTHHKNNHNNNTNKSDRKSWHQTLRALLVSNADFLSSTLHIPAALRTSFRFVFCFVASGLVHLLMDVGFGVSLSESGALWFFSLQVVGILLEVLVGRCLGKGMWMEDGNAKGKGWMRKAVGFVWVAGFMLWTVPVWVNPILRRLYLDGVRMMSPFLGFSGWEI